MNIIIDSSDGKEFAYNAGDLGREDPLEEGMATHSSILAWRVLMNRGKNTERFFIPFT